jgi:hypothetical protein
MREMPNLGALADDTPLIHIRGFMLEKIIHTTNIYYQDNLDNTCAAPTLRLAKDSNLLSFLPLSNVLISLRSNDRVAYGESGIVV